MDGDAGPAEHVVGMVVLRTSCIRTHALRRGVRSYHVAPVGFDGGWQERLGVRNDALAVSFGVVVDDARGWVDELVVRAEVEVKDFSKGGKRQSEGI
jgi:hypothetical protein